MTNSLVKILIMIGSSASIGFGIWHFFVPQIWKWYSYIASAATELVAAVRAINAFFSLSLVLFGIVNMLLVYGDKSNRYSIIVMLAATCVLWITRVAFQVIYPQGSLYPGLQYGMLSAFVLVTLCYLISLLSVLFQKIPVQALLSQVEQAMAGSKKREMKFTWKTKCCSSARWERSVWRRPPLPQVYALIPMIVGIPYILEMVFWSYVATNFANNIQSRPMINNYPVLLRAGFLKGLGDLFGAPMADGSARENSRPVFHHFACQHCESVSMVRALRPAPLKEARYSVSLIGGNKGHMCPDGPNWLTRVAIVFRMAHEDGA